jgi:lipopolysaccharide biosynthesis protein
MVRKKSVSHVKSWGCPVCPWQVYFLRGVAQHLAMKRDKVHEAWRVEHKLPEGHVPLPDSMKITWKIMDMLRECAEGKI